ncbi:MAG TPA: FAD/NAD(P)-binding protein [Kineosporiaceae bacterium]
MTTTFAPGAPRPTEDGTPEWDLLFVGAGASTAYTLVSLLDAMADADPRPPVRVVVVDRASDAFSGVPYGDRAARSCLLITSLHDFLPDEERARFCRWLSRNKHWVFDEFRASAGPFARAWWERHRIAIERDEFDEIFLPRYIFGEYLKDLTHRAIARAESAGRAQVAVVQDEVDAVRASSGGGFTVHGAAGVVPARRVVLAVGSPPARSRLGERQGQADAVLLDDPFADLPGALRRVAAGLAEPASRRTSPARPAHVVVLGGNASAMDVLYQINDLTGAGTDAAVFTVLTPRGELPARIEEHAEAPDFRPEEVETLSSSGTLRAADVYDAAVRDIERGRDGGFSPAHTLRPVSQAVFALLPRLSTEETIEFAGRWGARLGRHQRRAGLEYWEVVDRLTAEGRFRLVTGSFTGLAVDPDGATHVEFVGPAGGGRLDPPADVVVNCAGPSGDVRVAAPRLLDQLLREGVCQASRHGAGIAVGAGLQAAEGLYVMGPLLAGNLIEGGPVWHMEHCGRIISYGTRLGRQLAGDLCGSRSPVG